MSDHPADQSANEPGRSAVTSQQKLCGCGQELVRINLLVDGEAITMRSCSNCDRRSWHRGDEEVALEGVLHDLSSSPTRYRRNLAAR